MGLNLSNENENSFWYGWYERSYQTSRCDFAVPTSFRGCSRLSWELVIRPFWKTIIWSGLSQTMILRWSFASFCGRNHHRNGSFELQSALLLPSLYHYDEAGQDLIHMMATFVLMDRDSRKVHAVEPEIVAPYQSEFSKKLLRGPKYQSLEIQSARITMSVFTI